MSDTSKPNLRIFYDGGCKVCDWEVKKYLAMDERDALGKIDINASGFQASNYGLDAKSVRKYFQVLTADGKVIAGVDAFIEIWKNLDRPFARFAAKAGKFLPIHLLLQIGYSGFIYVRPYLPRNAPACADDSCTLD